MFLTYAHTHTLTYTRTHAHTHPHAPTHTHTHICTFTRIYKCTYTYTLAAALLLLHCEHTVATIYENHTLLLSQLVTPTLRIDSLVLWVNVPCSNTKSVRAHTHMRYEYFLLKPWTSLEPVYGVSKSENLIWTRQQKQQFASHFSTIVRLFRLLGWLAKEFIELKFTTRSSYWLLW